MTRTCHRSLVALAMVLFVGLPSAAGQLTGTIRGRITDKQGFALPGAYVYVTSPAMLGVQNYITSESGRFAFLDLPPGLYKVSVEMPGFKTVNVEGVVLSGGATATVNFKLEATEIEEEITSHEPTPAVDKDSARLATVLDRALLTHIPLARDFPSILDLVPGVIFEGDGPGYSFSVFGAPVTGNAFVVDAADLTDPVAGGSLSRIDVDAVDEVVIEAAGRPVGRVPVEGATVNVINKSGGNTFAGSLSAAYTGKGLSKQLWSEADLSEMDLAAPTLDRQNSDFSLTAGGPLLRDYAWAFLGVRYRFLSRTTPFTLWEDPLGGVNDPYPFKDRDLAANLKISARVPQKYRGTIEVALSRISEPVYQGDIAATTPLSATRSLAGQWLFLLRGGFSYQFAQNTVADLSLAIASSRQPLLLNIAGSLEPEYIDLGTGRFFGSGPYNDREQRKRFEAGATITRFQDRLLGAAHELVAGAEYETLDANSSAWKADDLVMYYLSGSPYLYGQGVSPVSGDTVGMGLVGFSVVPSLEDGMNIRRESKRLGFFGQDTINIGGRVSLSLGLRFDRTDAGFLALSKGQVGNEIAVALGDSEIAPTYAFNPFSLVGIGVWNSTITWNSLYPRAGLAIDVLGTGRTLLKLSYARIPEFMGLGYLKTIDPFPIDAVHDFIWYDENADGLPSDPDVDTYTLVAYDYDLYKASYFLKRVDPSLKAPLLDEWTAGLEQSLTRGLSFSLRYISRSEKNVIGEVLYDPDTGQPWYDPAASPEGWWVPFDTVVPAIDDYAQTPVTVYVPSTTAPAAFGRIQNVPELRRQYRGVEFSVCKRMSDNWQFFGSFVWGRSQGTAGLALPWRAGISAAPLTPNSFVNVTSESRTDLDRPLSLRLMGTVRFHYDIYLSLYFRLASGAPWARSVTVIPPEDWALANQAQMTPVTVYLESPGTRRLDSRKTLDLRLEKEFVRFGRVRASVYVDVMNVLGEKYRILDLNDGGVWMPSVEGAALGERTLSDTYQHYIYAAGARIFRLYFSLRF